MRQTEMKTTELRAIDAVFDLFFKAPREALEALADCYPDQWSIGGVDLYHRVIQLEGPGQLWELLSTEARELVVRVAIQRQKRLAAPDPEPTPPPPPAEAPEVPDFVPCPRCGGGVNASPPREGCPRCSGEGEVEHPLARLKSPAPAPAGAPPARSATWPARIATTTLRQHRPEGYRWRLRQELLEAVVCRGTLKAQWRAAQAAAGEFALPATVLSLPSEGGKGFAAWITSDRLEEALTTLAREHEEGNRARVDAAEAAWNPVARARLEAANFQDRLGAEALAAVFRTSESQWRRLLEDAVRLARRAW